MAGRRRRPALPNGLSVSKSRRDQKMDQKMSEQQNPVSPSGLFALVGFLAGIPISYFFQGEMVKKLSLVQYVKALPQMLGDITKPKAWDFLGDYVLTLLFTCVVCAFLGGAIERWWIRSNRGNDRTA
jgi:hypothetical protein